MEALLLALLAFMASRRDGGGSPPPPPSYPWQQPGQGWGGTWYGPWTAYYPAPGAPPAGPPAGGPPPFFPPQMPPAVPPTPYQPPAPVAWPWGGITAGGAGYVAPIPPGGGAPSWPTGGQPVTPPRPWRRIRSGDTGSGLSLKATGTSGRWRELLEANPGMTTYTAANGSTQLKPWDVGQRIYLPADWTKVADGLEPPQLVPLPGGAVAEAKGKGR